MILRVLTGLHAGKVVRIGHFPFSVGRGGADLNLNDQGVWAEHFRIVLEPDLRLRLICRPEATVRVGDVSMNEWLFKVGETFVCGGVKLSLERENTGQASQRWNERFLWLVLIAILAVEMMLVWLV